MAEDQALRARYELLNQEHPDYKANLPLWKMYYAAYEGGSLVYEYIRRHPREHMEIYRQRKERAFYLNYTDVVVKLGPSFVFSRDIVRRDKPLDSVDETESQQEVDPDIESFWKDASLAGESLDKVMKDAAIYTRVFGRVDLLLDMRQLPQDVQIVNEQQRQEQKLRPYTVMYFPWDISNWETDERGFYVWVRIRQGDSTMNDPDQPRKMKPDVLFQTWTRDRWVRERVIFDQESGEISSIQRDEDTHPVGRVPMQPIFSDRVRKSAIGLSMIRDIACVNIAVLNWSSLMDEEMYSKVFNILVMQQADGDSPTVEIGSNNVLGFTGTVAPSYLTPPSEPMDNLARRISEARDEMYRMSRMGSSLGLLQKESRSGIAYGYEFNETAQSLAELANTLENAENGIHEIFLAWLHPEGDKAREWAGVIDYPDEFGVQMMEDDLNTLALAKQNIRSETFKREMEKQVARQMTTKLPSDIRHQIDVEIDETEEVAVPPAGAAPSTTGETPPPDQLQTGAEIPQ